jgi:SAM-dependent methyltransferase
LKGSKTISVKAFSTLTDSIHDSKPFVLSWLLNIRHSIEFLQTRIRISNFHFYDVGCGTGISTIYARAWNFKAVSGFDFQSDFILSAKKNLECGIFINRDITFTEEDAVKFRIESPSVLFLFNPFGAEILAKFIAYNLPEIQKGETWMILQNDKLLVELLENGNFELVNRDSRRNISFLRGYRVS